MIRKFFVTNLLLLFAVALIAQVKSPEEFLGYKVGSRYTPHFKIVNYFQHVAANTTASFEVANMVKPTKDGHCS